jgi:hypothetical protein
MCNKGTQIAFNRSTTFGCFYLNDKFQNLFTYC